MAVRQATRTYRRTRTASSRKRPTVSVRRTRTRKEEPFPDWKQLQKGNRRRTKPASPGAIPLLATVSLYRVILWLLVLGFGLTLYIGHVLATAQTLNALRQERARNLSLHLKANRLQGLYDQRTGPAVIYRRAEALGLRQGMLPGPTIYLSD